MAALPPGVDLSTIPIAPNPNGDPPNFIDPPNQEALVLAAGVPLVATACVFVTVRVFSNLRIAGKLPSDDYLCLFSLITLIPYFGLSVSFRNATRHAWDTPLSFIINESFAKRLFAFNVFAGPTLWFCKAAILLLYLRIFFPKQWLRWTSYIVLVVTFLVYSVNIPLAAVWCTPRNGGPWDRSVTVRCRQLAILGPIHGAVSIAADLVIIVLPLPIIYQLQLKTRQKIGLAAVFLMGSFALIASIIAMYYRVQVYTSIDFSWDGPKTHVCVIAECSITIVVSCGPAVAAFWTHTITKSAFYSSLRSWFTRSFSSRPASGKDLGRSLSKGPSATPESTSQLVRPKGDYFELHNADHGKPRTFIETERTVARPENNGITKSMAFEHRYEERFP